MFLGELRSLTSYVNVWEVMENADWACVINVEKKRGTEQYYLTFKRVKIRYRDPNDESYFNQPFEIGNRVRLLDDIHLETSLSENSLSTNFEGVEDINAVRGKRSAKDRTGESSVNDDDDDLFSFDAAITGKKKAG